MSLIVFSHANSFGASTYRVLFDHLQTRGFTVRAIERFGHDPRYPVSNNWTHLVQQLIDFTREQVQQQGEPAWLVGHSFGGFASLMAAARAPELARGVLLLDSPLLGGWRATTLGVFKSTQLVGSVSPGAVSRRRRNSWPSREAALEHFRHKKAFARWDAQVLQDYIEQGTRDEGRGRNCHLQHATRQPGPAAAAPSAEMPRGLHWRGAIHRDEASGHGADRAGGTRAHHDARWQSSVPHGETLGHGSGYRGFPAGTAAALTACLGRLASAHRRAFGKLRQADL
jgi:pimeloyl-ACP methyl ester carboxylesterase